MKCKPTIKYFLCFCFGLASTAIAHAQECRALIVSIDHYPQDSGWEEIHARNDARLASSMLTTCGYLPQNIAMLANAQATKKRICRSLQALCNATRPGDHIYLHFSCHGQQMMDDNGDEEDGLDEALIPYDALYWYLPGEYEGQNHLRDDELGQWINLLRKKATDRGFVTVVLDACHSGTGNRLPEAGEYIRGTGYLFAPDNYIPTPGKHPELSLHLKAESGLAPTAVFSACLAQQTNYEYYDPANARYSGLLTYAFCKIAVGMKGKSTPTIAQFMERLVQEMKTLTARKSIRRQQTPYMECSDPKVPLALQRKLQ